MKVDVLSQCSHSLYGKRAASTFFNKEKESHMGLEQHENKL